MAQVMNENIEKLIQYIADELPHGCKDIKCYQCSLSVNYGANKHLCETMKMLAGRRSKL
ncbi:MAG: hypothetical protein K0A90_08065 [Methanosarcinaceae archaeon]|nr:hypothetical protein [Methanosarcinaceae archaeon]MCL7410873.1 hypothetical protein [Methanosarcinaceae archaeon]